MISGSKFKRNACTCVELQTQNIINLTVHGSTFVGNRAADQGDAIQISGKGNRNLHNAEQQD